MNTKRYVHVMLASLALAGLPAAADERADFLREMARTDGNPQGDNAVPQPSAGDVAKLTKEQIAFFRELARTDGSVGVEPVETPDPALASR